MENTIPWILLGEVLHRYFRALLDYFCLHFLCRCRGTVAAFPPNLVCPRICILLFCKNKNIFFSFYHHEIHSYPIPVRFKGRVCWATTKTKPFIWRWTPPWLDSHGLGQPFSGLDNENPCNHLHEFEEVCSCLSISGMKQQTLRWKLYPFSLTGKAKQWYMFAVESMNGDWDELKDKFYLAFFPMSRIDSLPRAILDFEQREKESIGAA